MNGHRDEPATKKDLDQVKQELTDKIDKIALQVIENREQMAIKDEVDKRFDEVDKRFDAVDKRFGEVDKRFDVVNERFDEVDKRFDVVNERFDELLRGQDEMIGIFTRLDEERVATTAWIKRVEGDVETNKGEIKRIKTKLTMDT
jgi:chromosome segregation ATPase